MEKEIQAQLIEALMEMQEAGIRLQDILRAASLLIGDYAEHSNAQAASYIELAQERVEMAARNLDRADELESGKTA